MTFRIPQSLSRTSKSERKGNTQNSPSDLLHQHQARPRQDAGGSLIQDGPDSQPAPPLAQREYKSRQDSNSLRSGLARLRDKLQYNGKKLQKTPPSSSATAQPAVGSTNQTRHSASRWTGRQHGASLSSGDRDTREQAGNPAAADPATDSTETENQGQPQREEKPSRFARLREKLHRNGRQSQTQSALQYNSDLSSDDANSGRNREAAAATWQNSTSPDASAGTYRQQAPRATVNRDDADSLQKGIQRAEQQVTFGRYQPLKRTGLAKTTQKPLPSLPSEAKSTGRYTRLAGRGHAPAALTREQSPSASEPDLYQQLRQQPATDPRQPLIAATEQNPGLRHKIRTKLQKRPLIDGRPPASGPMPDLKESAQYIRAATQQKKPGVMSRYTGKIAASRLKNSLSSRRKAEAPRLSAADLTLPPIPAHPPLFHRDEQFTSQFVNDTVQAIINEQETLHPDTPVEAPPESPSTAPLSPFLSPLPEMDNTLPERPRPARQKQVPRMPAIKEESNAEVEKSQLNPLQLIAHRAAERDSAEHREGLLPQTVALSLDMKGRLSLSECASANLQDVLEATVASPEHIYQAHSATHDNSQHLLLSKEGTVIALQGSKTAFIGLTQSVPAVETKAHPTSPLSRLQKTYITKPQLHRKKLFIHQGEMKDQLDVTLPGQPIHSHLTGIFHHLREKISPEGLQVVHEQLREHRGHLYRLNEPQMRWEKTWQDEGKRYSTLTRQANNELYAILDDKLLHNISTGEKSAKFDKIISQYCVNEAGNTLLLLRDESTAEQSVKWIVKLDDKPADQHSITLKLSQGTEQQPFHATQITLHDGRLYAIGSNGKLFSATEPQANSKELVLQDEKKRTALLNEQFGNKFTLEKFLNHGDDELHTLVKDQNDQIHSCVLTPNGLLQPEWNLSDSLVIDHHAGLLQPRPLPQEKVDLGRLGQVTLHDGTLHVFNKNEQRWEASWESADSIKRGRDGQGYVLKEGIPFRIIVNQSSTGISGESNRFFLRQMKNQISLSEPLPGISSQNKALAIAPLDALRFVALTEDSELTVHHNKPESQQPVKLARQLSKQGINNWLPMVQSGTADPLPETGYGNTLTDVAFDPEQSLYALDKQGTLYTLAKDQWQNSQTQHWQPVPLPDHLTTLNSLHNAPDGSLMIADKNGRSAILQLAGQRIDADVTDGDDGIHQLLDYSSDPSADAEVTTLNTQQIANANRWLIQPDYDPDKKLEAISHHRDKEEAEKRLVTAAQSTRVLGMTMTREFNLIGMTGQDVSQVNSRLRDRMRAHVFNPTISVPRPVKNAYYHMQHSWQGREGLRPLYQHLTRLHNDMQTLLATQPKEEISSDLLTRLNKLQGKSFNKTFLENLKQFGHALTDSARHHAGLIGQHTRALQANQTASGRSQPIQRRAFTQALNINSDSSNLVADLAALYQRFPMRSREDVHKLLQSLDNQGVVLNHQKSRPPLNRQRDPHDQINLAKSRLILDGLTMGKLHRLVAKMEKIAASPQTIAAQSTTLREQFRELRDVIYGEDMVRKATSQGFISLRSLEACYDAIKSMIKAFSKPHHGLNMTTRTVLNAQDQQQMITNLHSTILSLSQGENMGFGRNYTAQLTLSVIPGTDVVGVPGVTGTFERAYNASFSRGATGIDVSFSRNGGGTGLVFGAVGWNTLSLADNSEDIKADMGDGRSITPSARLGGMITMALQKQLQNNVSFTLSEAELSSFIEQMVTGKLNPMQLMDKGMNHQVNSGTTLTFNLDGALSAVAGGGLNIPTSEADSQRNVATLRGNVIAQVGANLATARRERTVAHKEESVTSGHSDNRMRFLNNASSSLGIAGGIGITPNASHKLRVPMFGVSSTNIQASIDNRTRQNMRINISRSRPPKKQHLENLIEFASLAFNEPQLNKLLQQMKNADKPPEKIKKALKPAVKNLKEQSLHERQHPTSGANLRPLTKAEREALEKLSQDDATSADTYTQSDTSEEKFSTWWMDEKEAVKAGLDKLTGVLEAKIPTNNDQYAVIHSAKQLRLKQQAADLHSQSLNSAEFQTTYNNLHKINSNNLMHVMHSLIASELPPSNAERISSFMEQKPILKKVIRELQKHSDTKATVTLEMKDSEMLKAQKAWLQLNTQPEDIRQTLQNRNNLRVKSISFVTTHRKPEGTHIPFLITGGSSSANVSMTTNLGQINFAYGENQDTPHSFTLEGEIAHAPEQVIAALSNAEIQEKRGLKNAM